MELINLLEKIISIVCPVISIVISIIALRNSNVAIKSVNNFIVEKCPKKQESNNNKDSIISQIM